MERLINFIAAYASNPLGMQSTMLKMTFVSTIIVVILSIAVDLFTNQLYLIR